MSVETSSNNVNHKTTSPKNMVNLDDHTNNKENFKQFELNEEKFNLKSSYNENIYTTEIDYNVITEDIVQRAQTLENVIFVIIKEILSQNSKNPHLMEDRGQYDASLTEEMRYSTVERFSSMYSIIY